MINGNAQTELTSVRKHCSVSIMAHSDVRRYQRRNSVPRILGPRSLPVPHTNTSHDTSQITTSQRVMLFNAINAYNTFNARKPHQRSMHTLGSGSTPLRFWSRSCCCNISLGLGMVGLVLLRSCKVANLLMVINAAVSAAHSTPACTPRTPAITQLLITSLTALLVCSMVFVVIGAQNGSSFNVACGCDGVAGVNSHRALYPYTTIRNTDLQLTMSNLTSVQYYEFFWDIFCPIFHCRPP